MPVFNGNKDNLVKYIKQTSSIIKTFPTEFARIAFVLASEAPMTAPTKSDGFFIMTRRKKKIDSQIEGSVVRITPKFHLRHY
jgi:hypothetical protein